MRGLRGLLVLVGVVATACKQPSGTACPGITHPVVIADLRDSITGLPAWHKSSLVLQGAGVYDSVLYSASPPSDSVRPNQLSTDPDGKPGVYEVRVRNPAYQLWTKSGIVAVYSDAWCGVYPTTFLVVRLQRLP